MKAVELHGYGGVDQLKYEDVPAPKPGPDEVVVKVAATSVNPIDWKVRRGDFKSMAPLHFPVIPGRDVAGEVVDVGVNVSQWKRGQKVMGVINGTYAEYAKAAGNVLTAIPEGLDAEKAAALPLVTTTGAELIDAIQLKRGETVLVIGAAGGVGRTAVYVAKQRGARVIAGVLEKQKKQAESLGADQVVALDKDDGVRALPQLDAIADTVGGAAIEKAIGKLKPGGVLGSVVGKPKAADGKNVRVEALMSHPDPELLGKLAEAVRDHAFDIPVARKFKLNQAAEAQALAERGGVDGKITLVP